MQTSYQYSIEDIDNEIVCIDHFPYKIMTNFVTTIAVYQNRQL